MVVQWINEWLVKLAAILDSFFHEMINITSTSTDVEGGGDE